jgi:hypothetical protein
MRRPAAYALPREVGETEAAIKGLPSTISCILILLLDSLLCRTPDATDASLSSRTGWLTLATERPATVLLGLRMQVVSLCERFDRSTLVAGRGRFFGLLH